MKKAAVTYSDRRRRIEKRPAVRKERKRILPRWMPYGATAIFAAVLCLTINFRAYTELSSEIDQNKSLNSEIEKVTSENLDLQEEIYYLQNDSSTIEREAKKFGFQRKEKKVSVPADK